MRLKLKKDIEAPFRVEIDAKDKEISRLVERNNTLKRQYELSKTEVDALKFDKEKEVSSLKERMSKEISDLMLENQGLVFKADDSKDREIIRELRRELDECKRRQADLL